MKKIINDPNSVVSEMLQGYERAHPDVVYTSALEVISRKSKKAGKVGIITGGGSGHEPAFAGYVGYGMLDAAVSGHVFSSPSPDRILEAIRSANNGNGVFAVIMNYEGDKMNFSMARELAQAEGIITELAIVRDDIAVEDSTYSTGRRGIAGTIFVHKLVGAAAEQGWNMDRLKSLADKAIMSVRTIGMAMSACTIPAVGKANFSLGEDEVEIGMGIHGEPGITRTTLPTAKALATTLTSRLLAETDYAASEVAVMINGLGATPLMELYILYNEVAMILAERGISVYRTFVGNYMTSLEMAGGSMTLLKLDDEMKALLDFPCTAPAFRV